MKQQGEFMRQIAQDREQFRHSELDELLGVARQAGIQVKDPSERLNKFQLDDDDDDLDLSVQFEDDDDEESSNREADDASSVQRRNNNDSITRMDEDTGASGVW